ncbi:MAG: beta-ketoacyl-ACP synthase III [Saprospiraceae bacterium]
MSKIRASITGVHGYVPDYVLSNKELETMVDTNDEWIFSRTGIKERRILKDKSLAASDMGVKMVEGLLEKTNTKPEEIEMLLCATITPDMVFPDTANTISDKIGAKNSFGYDINAACSGFLYALNTGAKFIETGTYKKVVIVGLDVMSSIIDYSDRATCVIFGDGGGAVMLEPTTDGTGIQDSILRSNGHGRHFLHMKAGGSLKPTTMDSVAAREHYVYQEGRTVFKHAVSGMTSAVADLFAQNQLEEKDIDWLVPHQANKRIIDVVAGQLDFPMEKVMVNIHKYGNTTAGTLPLCLWDWEDKLKKGDKIVLTAFGGGFTWGATYLIWS